MRCPVLVLRLGARRIMPIRDLCSLWFASASHMTQQWARWWTTMQQHRDGWEPIGTESRVLVLGKDVRRLQGLLSLKRDTVQSAT